MVVRCACGSLCPMSIVPVPSSSWHCASLDSELQVGDVPGPPAPLYTREQGRTFLHPIQGRRAMHPGSARKRNERHQARQTGRPRRKARGAVRSRNHRRHVTNTAPIQTQKASVARTGSLGIIQGLAAWGGSLFFSGRLRVSVVCLCYQSPCQACEQALAAGAHVCALERAGAGIRGKCTKRSSGTRPRKRRRRKSTSWIRIRLLVPSPHWIRSERQCGSGRDTSANIERANVCELDKPTVATRLGTNQTIMGGRNRQTRSQRPTDAGTPTSQHNTSHAQTQTQAQTPQNNKHDKRIVKTCPHALDQRVAAKTAGGVFCDSVLYPVCLHASLNRCGAFALLCCT